METFKWKEMKLYPIVLRKVVNNYVHSESTNVRKPILFVWEACEFSCSNLWCSPEGGEGVECVRVVCVEWERGNDSCVSRRFICELLTREEFKKWNVRRSHGFVAERTLAFEILWQFDAFFSYQWMHKWCVSLWCCSLSGKQPGENEVLY